MNPGLLVPSSPPPQPSLGTWAARACLWASLASAIATRSRNRFSISARSASASFRSWGPPVGGGAQTDTTSLRKTRNLSPLPPPTTAKVGFKKGGAVVPDLPRPLFSLFSGDLMINTQQAAEGRHRQSHSILGFTLGVHHSGGIAGNPP